MCTRVKIVLHVKRLGTLSEVVHITFDTIMMKRFKTAQHCVVFSSGTNFSRQSVIAEQNTHWVYDFRITEMFRIVPDQRILGRPISNEKLALNKYNNRIRIWPGMNAFDNGKCWTQTYIPLLSIVRRNGGMWLAELDSDLQTADWLLS